MLKKKNMAMVMAGVTVATSVAPVFANEVKEDKNYNLNYKESAKLVEGVRKALEVKYEETKKGATVGTSVYSIQVVSGEDRKDITNGTDLQDKIDALADGATLTVEIQDKGHQVINNKVVDYKFEQYKTASEIVDEVNKANNPAGTLVATIKSADTVEVKLNKDAKEAVTIKVGQDKLNFKAPKLEKDKLVGFEKLPVDIENGEKHIVTVKKTDAKMTSADAEKLFDGMRLTTEGMKLEKAIKEAGKDAVISDVTLAPGFAGEGKFDITFKKDSKEVEVVTISGDNLIVARLHSKLTNDNSIKGTVETIAGEDRFKTAIEVSKKGFEVGKADAVVLVGKDAVVDGLAAAPLAAEKKAPILLTNKDGLTKETEAEMLRVFGTNVEGKTIYVIGGESQFSKVAEENLAKLGATVKRLAGDSRYETSLKIAKELNSQNNTSFVVGGNGEVDAMSIAAHAANTKSPIIVTNKDAVNEDAIKALNGKELVIVGGTSSVSDAVKTQLEEIDKNKAVERLAGNDRQGTNAKVIAKYHGNAKTAYVAKDGYGVGKSHLIDALTAAPLAGKDNAPIVLATNNVSVDQAETAQLTLKGKVTSIVQIGQGISQTVLTKLGEVLNLF
ncbi:cell wall-binding repeat-containing protein [Romboutsia sp. 1001216sp1]|uniref:cell wall-binding repeat-containing protein n=1 Tax=Romboutsia sp. 1001216sp1 TaxID=2986997 RepID=UPI002331254E|nr:cell wall-binding repeat-containing protein [Romboutsia sp. 1001216sp1]MDB8789326.1 cell wall-binding repeat-containing protein [Romboutsia sp. 1001216sp1]